ncbi:uncharacterized protein [Henckelia pumila]|uniref:uncharacterized protein isoform X3 n=1 Tax=Henckelia pumila TaxID=405737 RepID=UPI003C6E5520
MGMNMVLKAFFTLSFDIISLIPVLTYKIEIFHSFFDSSQIKLPRVTVVMPLKGFGEHNIHNWRTQIFPIMNHYLSIAT